MCFYYQLSHLAQRHAARAKEPLMGIADLVNGFRHPLLPVVRRDGAVMMHWGLVPAASPQFDLSTSHLNARRETAHEKPAFRHAMVTQHCLVPATGFFEWQHVGSTKQPWFVRLRNAHDFSFAGIYDVWQDDSSGQVLASFTILTTDANDTMAGIHNTQKRMPVILPLAMEQEWLAPDISDSDIVELTNPLDDALLEAWPVKPFRPQHPSPDLSKRWDGGMQSLF